MLDAIISFLIVSLAVGIAYVFQWVSTLKDHINVTRSVDKFNEYEMEINKL